MCNTIVLFRGGQGGNFLNYIVKKYTIGDDSNDIIKTKTNEYISIESNGIGHAHINQWFKRLDNPNYGYEVYSINRFKYVLDKIKNNKTKFIVISNNKDLAWTEALGYLKTGNGKMTISKTYSNFVNFQNGENLDRYNDELHYQNWGKIYNWLHKVLSKKMSAMLIEYQDLFINCDEATICNLADFCGITQTDDFYNEIKMYSQKNIQLMKDEGIEWKS